MSLHVCEDCQTAYLPAPQCPQCGGGVYRFSWEEETMPKITVEGGATAYHDDNPAPVEPDVDVVDLNAPARATVRKAVAASKSAAKKAAAAGEESGLYVMPDVQAPVPTPASSGAPADYDG